MENRLKEAINIVTKASSDTNTKAIQGRARKEACLIEPIAAELLNVFGIRTPDMTLTNSVEDALNVAKSIGFPIALKVVSTEIVHKSDVGGVKTGIKDPESLKIAYNKMLNDLKSNVPGVNIAGILVEKMVPLTTEVIIGALRDSQFGPVVMFGLGGIFVEVIKDVSFRLAPINKKESLEMIKETNVFPILNGFRNIPPLDIYNTARTILSVSKMITQIEQINEIDLNPVLVYPKGIIVVDAKIILKQ